MKKFVVKCRKKIGVKKMAEEEKKKPRMSGHNTFYKSFKSKKFKRD